MKKIEKIDSCLVLFGVEERYLDLSKHPKYICSRFCKEELRRILINSCKTIKCHLSLKKNPYLNFSRSLSESALILS